MLKLLNLHKRSLATLLAVMVLLMLAGCSSTDEAAQPEETGGSSCAEQCANQGVNADECMVACGA
jgi:uncharacterized lipoprotein